MITPLAACVIWTNAHAQSGQDAHRTGRELADIHCVRCHLAPDPAELPKEMWPRMLLGMGLYLGFHGDELPEFVSVEDSDQAPPADFVVIKKLTDAEGNEQNFMGVKEFVLSEPIISEAEWFAIRDYYIDNAPPMADWVVPPPPENPRLEAFTPTVPDLDLAPNGLVLSTAVDDANQRLYIGRAVGTLTLRVSGQEIADKEELIAFDMKTGERLGSAPLDSEPIDMELTETGVRLSAHGWAPLDVGKGNGHITDFTGLETGKPQRRMLLGGAYRIAQSHNHDLNGDGLEDIVVAKYGDGNQHVHGGGLSILWQTPEFAEIWKDAPAEIPRGPLEGALRETVLTNHVGPVGSAIADFNNDGRPDIALLVAQGWQDVSVFVNQGDGEFTQQIVKRYPPTLNGDSINAADVDGDGLTDIIVLHGDNPGGNYIGGPNNLLNPDHGVRVLQNNGDMTFTERYHYYMQGAVRSTVADYDGDGDQDIAALGLYADWSSEEPETFVYLENQGGFEFKPYSMPREHFGIWGSIDTADVNADNKPDIVLGLANWPGFVPPDWTTRPIMEGRNGEAATITFLLNDY